MTTNFDHRIYRSFLLLISLLLAGALVGCAGDRSFGERVSDQTIETKVKTALLTAPDVSGTDIAVEVRSGDVLLTGFIESHLEAQRAVDMAKRVDGVENVISNLVVRELAAKWK